MEKLKLGSHSALASLDRGFTEYERLTTDDGLLTTHHCFPKTDNEIHHPVAFIQT